MAFAIERPPVVKDVLLNVLQGSQEIGLVGRLMDQGLQGELSETLRSFLAVDEPPQILPQIR